MNATCGLALPGRGGVSLLLTVKYGEAGMSARCTKPEAEFRRSWALEQLLASRPRVELVREAQQRWGLSAAQAQRIVRQAVELILATYREVDQEEAVGKAVHALEVALELAVQRKQPQEIIQAVRAMDQIIGIGAAHQLRVQPWR
jgi:fructose-specific phosphotransferase system component IIB